MESIEEVLTKIVESIKQRELAVFCGAGISYNSGLPLAKELERYILEKLNVDKEYIVELIKQEFPFEAFMEAITEYGENVSKILDIFGEVPKKPNINHILIAKLIKNGYLETVFTTNFDLLIEKALKNEGLENKDFELYYNEQQFAELNFSNCDIEDKTIRMFKIHGTITNPESIRTTMKLLTNESFSHKRKNIIEHLFSSGKHKKVLIMGYSCSDYYDIIPQIESIERNPKEIILIDHSNMRKEIEDIRIKDSQNPFKKFKGIRIIYNTDEIIKELWNSFGDVITGKYNFYKEEPKGIVVKQDFAKLGVDIDVLFENLIRNGYIDAKGAIQDKFRQILNYSAMTLDEIYGTKKLEIHAILQQRPKWKMYVDEWSKTRDAYSAYKMKQFGGSVFCHVTNILHIFSNLRDRIACSKLLVRESKKGLRIAVREKNEKGIAQSGRNLGYGYYCLGEAYYFLEDFEKAIRYLLVAEKILTKKAMTKHYILLDDDFFHNKSSPKNFYLDGNYNLLDDTYCLLGKVYYSLKDFDKTIKYFLMAERIRKTKKPIFIKGVRLRKKEPIYPIHPLEEIYSTLSDVYKEIKNDKNSKKYLDLSLWAAKFSEEI